jgi:hypothetical protein
MADKVDNLLEKMADELIFYQEETLFSDSEIRKIVKNRRKQEY